MLCRSLCKVDLELTVLRLSNSIEPHHCVKLALNLVELIFHRNQFLVDLLHLFLVKESVLLFLDHSYIPAVEIKLLEGV